MRDRQRVVHGPDVLRIASKIALIWLTGCAFDPPTLGPAPLGSACVGDSTCASAICSAGGVCAECRETSSCGAGRRCDADLGRCVAAEAPSGSHAHLRAVGHRSANQARVHIGRVGVPAVTSAAELR